MAAAAAAFISDPCEFMAAMEAGDGWVARVTSSYRNAESN